MRVWTDKYAGTIDLLCYDTLNECYVVVDWKSNSKTFEESDYSKQYLKQLKAPFQSYKSSKIEEYSIQLESYSAMLESIGIVVGRGKIVHAYFDDFDNYCDEYETLNMRELCKMWLEISII
jgi:ATP-dependent exoDNAse (exonuclease V) beta subunit